MNALDSSTGASSSARTLLRRSRARIWPMSWVWIALLTTALLAAALLAIHQRQRAIVVRFIEEQALLRQARIDLAKGYLQVSLSGSPEAPFDREQGLAMLEQAASSLERALELHRQYAAEGAGGTGATSLADFARQVSRFRGLLLDRRGAATRDPAREAELRIAFHSLERQAQAVDARTQEDLRRIVRHYDRLQVLSLFGSGILLAVVGAAVYAGARARATSEAALHQALAELKESDRRKSEFLGVLSHELRNPLAPIRNSLYVLERRAGDNEQVRRASAVIGRQVSQLARIVGDLLDVTRITQGKIELQRERLDLGVVVRRTLDDYRAEFEAHGLALEDRLGSDAVWVDADLARIAQVVGNLLGNALKFTPAGGRVEIALGTEGAAAVLRIRDTGAGLSPELIGQLFEPFSQGPQPLARTQGGLGLGLALVRRLVELHGGTVSAASEGPGRGAEFTVRLPLAQGPP